MKPAAIAPVLLVVILALAGCTSLPAPAPTHFGAGGTNAVTCTGGTVHFDTANGVNHLAADCASVQISGSNISVAAKGINTLAISGDNDRVTGTSIGTVTISGSNDGVRATTITSLTINGNNAAIAGYKSIGSVIVQGNDNTVTSPSIPTIQQSGNGNRIGKI